MSNQPVWLSEKAIKAIHAELIAEHGGESGILNSGSLSSTLKKPENLFAYGESPSIYDLAAAYGLGFLKNHCFVDGNKRIALVSVDIFLMRNGYELNATEQDAALFFLELANSLNPYEEDHERLANWIEANSGECNLIR